MVDAMVLGGLRRREVLGVPPLERFLKGFLARAHTINPLQFGADAPPIAGPDNAAESLCGTSTEMGRRGQKEPPADTRRYAG